MKKLIFLVCVLTIFSLQAMEESSICQKDFLDYSTDPETCARANLIVGSSCIAIGIVAASAPLCITMSPAVKGMVLTAGNATVCCGVQRSTYASVIKPGDDIPTRRVKQFFATLCCFVVPENKHKTKEKIGESTSPLVMEKS